MTASTASTGKILVWGLFLLLFVLHQDKWWWDNETLVLGFLPIGLAFHAVFSIGCSVLGWLAIKMAWPHDLEAFAEGDSTDAEKEGGEA